MSSTETSLRMHRVRAFPKTGARVRGLVPLGLCLLPVVLFWDLSKAVAALTLTNDSFSPLLLIPFVSLFLIYQNRRPIFAEVFFDWGLGAAFLLPASAILLGAQFNLARFRPTNQGMLFVLGAVLVWLGVFALFFGKHAFRAARFPLLFLFFSVPIPEPLLSVIVVFLQRQSANATEMFFRLGGVPYLRQDLVFQLPGVAIRVAEECSGIRSSLALLITTVLAAHLFLRSNRRRLALCAVVVPLAILKNGLRIATLSTLAIYVDPGFLNGNLHHRGGIVFFAVILVPMAILLHLLSKNEQRSAVAAKYCA